MTVHTEERSKIKFVVCPNCQGVGCDQCRDSGVVGLLDQYVLYWQKDISGFSIIQEKTTKFSHTLFVICLWLISIWGMVNLFWQLSDWRDIMFSRNFSETVWLTQDTRIFFWWIGLASLMYLFYDYEMQRKQGKEIPLRGYASLSSTQGEADWNMIAAVPAKQWLNVVEYFRPEADHVVDAAWMVGRNWQHKEIFPLHFFVALLKQKDVQSVFVRLAIDGGLLKSKIQSALNVVGDQGGRTNSWPTRSVAATKLLLTAFVHAYDDHEKKVDDDDLLTALIIDEGLAKDVLIDLGITGEELINAVVWLRVNKKLSERARQFSGLARFKPRGTMDRAMTAVATPFLDSISEDLTLLARGGYMSIVVGRDQEINETFQKIESGAHGIIFVGFPGVGKTAIVEGIAQKMAVEDVPQKLQDKRLVRISAASLIAGGAQGEAEQRCQTAINEIVRAGNIAVVIDNIDVLSTAGGNINLASVFAEAVAQGLFILFATSTSENYQSLVEGTSLGNILQKIDVHEATDNQAIQTLEARAGYIEGKSGVYLSYPAIEKAVVLSRRYLPDTYLPSKALNLIEQVAIVVGQMRGKGSWVMEEDVATLVANTTRIPVTQVTQSESAKLLNLENDIHERMIDQEEAVKAVSSALRRSRAELRDVKRPIVNLLFLGPTGVGKTELTKTVAELYFGSEEKMIRLDMSEYQEAASLRRLIGAPPGSGAERDQAGFLTESVRKNPFSLVLLDELEKAHPEILNIFLQVMDDGRLTDNLGRTVDFTNTIIIATSNAGGQFIQDSMRRGLSVEQIKSQLLEDQLKQYFRPEFINRFDSVVVFKPLSQDDVTAIARLLIKKVGKRLADKGINFKATDAAIKELAQLGFDPAYGARPLRRVIQERVDDALATYLLQGHITRRDTIVYDVGGELKVEKGVEL